MTRYNSQPDIAATAGTNTGASAGKYPWVLLAVCFLITTLTYAGMYSFGLFFKPLQAEFGWSSAQTAGVFSLFMFCYCLFGILTGVAVDRIGPRITVVAGGFCLGSGFLLSGMVHNLWEIYLSYGLLAGAGMSSVYGPVMTTASRWFRHKQGLALGVVSSGIGLGTFIGPPIFGHLIPSYGWRFSYLAAGTGIGSAMVLLGLLLRKDPVQASERPAEKNEAADETRDRQTSGVDEWSSWEVICTKPFWLFSAVFLMVGFGLQMMLAHLVPYMQERYTLSPSAAAAVFSVIGVASVAGRLIMGGVSDYLGSRKSLALSIVMEGMAVILILLSTRQWMLYLSGVCFGFGYGGHAPQFPALIRELFGMKRMGRNLGLQQIFYGGGALLGPLLAGWMFDRAGSYVAPFLIAAGVLMLAGWLGLALKRPARWDANAASEPFSCKEIGSSG
jgi:MFS transporter, OFA family, oxalate/formate antiporter